MFSINGRNMFQSTSSKLWDQRKKLILWACSLFLLLVSIATVSSLAIKLQDGKAKSFPSQPGVTISRAIVSACTKTHYKEACVSSLTSIAGDLPNTPRELFNISIQKAIDRALTARSHASNITPLVQKAITNLPIGVDDCIELLDDSVDQLRNILHSPKGSTADIQTWLSATITNQETCLDSLESVNSPLGKKLMQEAKNLSQLISNSLAMFKSMKGGEFSKSGRGRRLSSIEFPDWVPMSDRKVLITPIEWLRAHAVVAKDGSGTHETIGEALLATSIEGSDGGGRTVIHVKAGTYDEAIKISNGQKNVMLVGDGKGVTVITGRKSAADGYTTYSSATAGVNGDGFIARDITFVNGAGPSEHQAVALRVASDKSVIYRCALDGYQDTLYALSKRQFYREADIYGTIDFIFGNAAAVFQNCNINAKGGGSSKNFITAQGRTDPNQNTGISIQNCRILATSGTETYLGRPWKQYSRTLVMQSYLDGAINQAGWYPWSGSFGLKTLFYGEYMNSGAGASTAGRVGWDGYHPSMTTTQASQFTVTEFISGDQWLPSTGIPFNAGL